MEGCVRPSIGDLLKEADSGRFFSYFWRTAGHAHLAPIGVKGQLLTAVPLNRFHSRLDCGKLVVWKAEAHEVDEVESFSDASLDHGVKQFERLQPALEDKNRLVWPGERSKLFNELKKSDPKLSLSTYYKAVRYFVEGGASHIALRGRWAGTKRKWKVDDYLELSFAVAKEYVRAKALAIQASPARPRTESDHTKSGAPRQRRDAYEPSEYRVNEAASLRVFDEYFKRKRVAGTTLVVLHEKMLEEVFSSPQPTGPSLRWPSRSAPALKTFCHWYRVLYGHLERRANERGPKHVQLGERPKRSEVSSAVSIVGAVGELDATVWNVELVGEEEGAPLIGPPIVFRVRCRGSGELLGMSVSLVSACWNSAAAALANCLENKKAYCEKFDVPLPDGVWDVQGLPALVLADQGETYNDKPVRFIRTSGCTVSNLPGASGDLKPGVESDFNTLQVKLNAITPGAIIKKYEGITHQQWAMRGRMTLKQFTALLLVQEIKKMLAPRPGLQIDPAMSAAGFDTSPNSVWRWGEHRRGTGLVRPRNTRRVLLSLLPIKKASITDKGLTVDDLYYTGDELLVVQAQDAARLRGRRRLRVAYDPSLVDSVHVMFGDDDTLPSRYVEYKLNPRFATQMRFEGRSWREYEAWRTEAARADKARVEAVQDVVRHLDALGADIIAQAEARVRAARAEHPQSRAALMAARPAARMEEANRTVPTNALTSSVLMTDTTDTAPSADVVKMADVKAAMAKKENRYRAAHQRSTLREDGGGSD